ncbi:N-acetylmuramoyl-L-alanine amidase [Lachnoclostridium sp. An76]|uniref:N-acetylmuramoyl-L-alanine amidase n=1 Tax=Lachnoclostridium sp. An76 TaxID=1965654 RepID=UPI000B381FF0|nr:N-acetylmuramoyl-L-alanine amidase [Lachnoclostridium sp. An76]OUN34976.1 N-acetylmuramoyl-L-alanine amidase [Lachnoclostridium sp. An76]
MPYSIMLDAGHGGKDPGAVYNGRQEKDDTLALTLAVGEILQGRGIDVLYTRTTDVYESPYQKAMEANEAGADFFVSIHRNSYPTDNTASGVETLVYDRSGLKLQMAENIDEQLEAIGFVNLGVKERPGLVVLRRTRMPAVLVEAGFINSNTDNQLFDDNFGGIALAIAEGILDTLQMNGLIGNDMLPDSDPGDTDNMPGGGNTPGRPGNEPGHSGGIPQYTVQAGAFRNGAYADRLQKELLEQDFPAVTSQDGGLYRVTVGTFPTLDEAADMERRLKRAGYQTVIVSS